jgi:hypothetical protein
MVVLLKNRVTIGHLKTYEKSANLFHINPPNILLLQQKNFFIINGFIKFNEK